MMTESKRRTKAQYLRLFDNPTLLDPSKSSAESASVVLFPNGSREIWVTASDGLGMRLRVSNGPHGLSVVVAPFAGTPDITAVENGLRETACVQYRDTPKAQAFKRWYQCAETPDDIATLGAEYQR